LAVGHFSNVTVEALMQFGTDDNHRKKWDQYAIEINTLDEIDGAKCIYWSCKSRTAKLHPFVTVFFFFLSALLCSV
jgi:hypothetical protein